MRRYCFTIFIVLSISAIYIKQNVDAQQKVPWLIPPQFDYVGDFSEGLGLVKKNGKFGFVNKDGRFVIKPQFFDANSFYGGMAAVKIKKDDKFGFINKEGKIVT